MCDAIVCALKCCCASTIGVGVCMYWLCSPRFRKELREMRDEKYEEAEKKRNEINATLSRMDERETKQKNRELNMRRMVSKDVELKRKVDIRLKYNTKYNIREMQVIEECIQEHNKNRMRERAHVLAKECHSYVLAYQVAMDEFDAELDASPK